MVCLMLQIANHNDLMYKDWSHILWVLILLQWLTLCVAFFSSLYLSYIYYLQIALIDKITPWIVHCYTVIFPFTSVALVTHHFS